MFKRSLLPLLLVMVFSFQAFGQQNYNGKFRFIDGDWDDYTFDDWSSDRSPFMEINYGFSDTKHDKFTGDFLQLGFGELKLGYGSRDAYFENYLLEFEEDYFVVSNFSKDLKDEEEITTDLELDVWRFGGGTRKGYGYRFGRTFAFLPYHERSFLFTRIKATSYDSLGTLAQFDDVAAENFSILERYHDGFRFTSASAAGVKLEFAESISVNASYEATVVMPRLMPWLYMGSGLIEHAGHSLIDVFVDEVIDSSPAAGPIINFLLHNAYSYAFYTLKKENMNWPFSTETPMTFETAKVGFSFRF